MRTRLTFLCLLALPAMLSAQRPTAAHDPNRTPPSQARQFDFLLGQWELTVRPEATTLGQRIHGVPKLIGTWKAWRALDGWGVADELRITDESGNPRGITFAVWLFDASARRWTATTADALRGTFTPSSGDWRDTRMEMTSKGVDPEGKAYVARARFTSITPTSFRFEQERSFDDGREWTRTLRIEAKRVSATAPR